MDGHGRFVLTGLLLRHCILTPANQTFHQRLPDGGNAELHRYRISGDVLQHGVSRQLVRGATPRRRGCAAVASTAAAGRRVATTDATLHRRYTQPARRRGRRRGGDGVLVADEYVDRTETHRQQRCLDSAVSVTAVAQQQRR